MTKHVIVLITLLLCVSLVNGDMNEENFYESDTRLTSRDVTIEINPSSVNTNVSCGDTASVTLTITNNGTESLDWSTLILNETKQSKKYSLQKDSWDLQFTWISYPSVNTELGIETNGNYFYTTSQIESGVFYRYQMDGLYIEQFTISNVPYTLNEITYDGEYFYGCSMDTNIIYILDLDNEQLIGTILTVADGNILSIAYDCDSDGFWIRCGYGIGGDDVILVDRSGSYVTDVSFEPEFYSGLVYDPYSDGGPYLWALNDFDGMIYQIDVSSGTLTGFSFDVCDNLGVFSPTGGLFIAENDYSQGVVTIGGLIQSSKLVFGYELCPYHPRWMTLNPISGTVAPSGGSENITLFFDARDDPEGTIHTCEIQFEAVQNVPSVTVPVTFYVGTPSYGDIAGTVTAATGGEPIEGAEVTISSDADISYIAYTNSLGSYSIEDIIAGVYTVASKSEGYNDMVTSDVEIFAGEITTLDIEMTAPVMVVDSTNIYTYVDPDDPIQIDITIQNTGNGPLEWNAVVAECKKEPTRQTVYTEFPRGSAKMSSDIAPLHERSDNDYIKSGKPFLSESIGYGYQYISPEEVFWTDTTIPDVLNNLFTPDFYTHAGEFPNGSDTHMYFCDKFTYYLLDVDVTSGEVNTVGSTGLYSYVDDLACDRTTGIMYGLHENTIYTVDLDNGQFSEVGPIGNGIGYMIAIAIDGNGNMWGHDLNLDGIWYIDKTTGAGTSIGSTGFDANYAQSMAWDPVTDTVYLAAFNNANYYYELRSVDLSTGWTTLLGGIYYMEVTVLSFPGEITTPWITLEPSTDIVPASGSSTLSVHLNTIDHSIGEVLYAEIKIYSEPDVGEVTIPVVVNVGTNSSNENPHIQESTLFGNFPNPVLDMTNIKFSLKENAHVKLSVYNLKGQLVDVLLDDELCPIEEYSIQWDGKVNGKDLTNGVYFYKLETDNKTSIKKMLLMR